MRHVKISPVGTALAFVIGATVGSALDGLHSWSGTTRYSEEWILKMAWWTPLLFGGAAVGVLGAWPTYETIAKRPAAPHVSGHDLTILSIGFALTYAMTGFLPTSNVVKLLLASAFALFACLRAGKTLPAIGLAALTAIVGPVVEVTLIRNGKFLHLQPDFLGIPMWLPGLYAAAAFAMNPVGRALHEAFARSSPERDVALRDQPSR